MSTKNTNASCSSFGLPSLRVGVGFVVATPYCSQCMTNLSVLGVAISSTHHPCYCATLWTQSSCWPLATVFQMPPEPLGQNVRCPILVQCMLLLSFGSIPTDALAHPFFLPTDTDGKREIEKIKNDALREPNLFVETLLQVHQKYLPLPPHHNRESTTRRGMRWEQCRGVCHPATPCSCHSKQMPRYARLYSPRIT